MVMRQRGVSAPMCSKTNQPIIIAMTANAMVGDREKCIEAGMNDYMSKPILIDEVKRIIKKWYDTIHINTKERIL